MTMSIRRKLQVGFGTTLVMMNVIGYEAYTFNVEVAAQFRGLYEDNVHAAVELSSAENAMWQLRYALPQFLVYDEAERIKIMGESAKWQKQIEDAFKSYAAGDRTPEELAALKEWEEVYAKYSGARPRWFELVMAGKMEEAARWRAETTFPWGAGSVKALGNLIQLQKRVGEQRLAAAAENARRTNNLLVTLVLLALGLGIASTLILARNITHPINELVANARRIADGKLGDPMKIDRDDEMGQLMMAMDSVGNYLREMAGVAGRIAAGDLTAEIQPRSKEDQFGQALKSMIGSMRGIIQELAEGVTRLNAATGELVAGSSQQSAVIAQQASSITQASTSLDEIRAIVNQANEKARSVVQVSERSLEVSKTGQAALDQVTGAMRSIKDQVEAIADNILDLSEKTVQIGEITASVNDIAEQCNLLAVNAAIEATKAGDAGRGFGVVAVEVKNLATQSKQATGQVRSILSDIQKATHSTVMVTEEGGKRVESGVEQVHHVGGNIKQLYDVITDSASAARQIAAATHQQVAGIEQIATAMKDINQVSTAAVAASNQQTTTARDLERLAQGINTIVQRYRLA